MAKQQESKSLRDYASFELERKGYDRAQVDAFLSELDQAFEELEKAVKERGDEVAELQVEVQRLKRESPVARSDEMLRRAELNAEQMLASSLTESQKIISSAETLAMNIIANARAQSQEIATHPPGFGMLARVRTIAADIDRMKAEHAALMEEEPELLAAPDPDDAIDEAPLVVFGEQEAAVGEAPVPEEPRTTTAESPAKMPAAAPEPRSAETEPTTATTTKSTAEKPATTKEPAATKPATADKLAAERPAAAAAPVADSALEEPDLPLVKPMTPSPPEPEPASAAAPDEETLVDPKNFDWKAARQEVLNALDDEEDVDDALDEPNEVSTIMRRQGSRYERHSAGLPRLGEDAETTLSEVSKVSRGRRRRAAIRDDENR